MKEQIIVIKETLARSIRVQAETVAEARNAVAEAYWNAKIVLGAEDYQTTEFPRDTQKYSKNEREKIPKLTHFTKGDKR